MSSPTKFGGLGYDVFWCRITLLGICAALTEGMAAGLLGTVVVAARFFEHCIVMRTPLRGFWAGCSSLETLLDLLPLV